MRTDEERHAQRTHERRGVEEVGKVSDHGVQLAEALVTVWGEDEVVHGVRRDAHDRILQGGGEGRLHGARQEGQQPTLQAR